MSNLLKKEFRLSASPITYFFIPFGLFFLLPGYPILLSVFFVTLGIFRSYQNYRESNDFIYSALLPIAKKDIVKGKYLFSSIIELVSFLFMLFASLLRMTILKDVTVYQENALMNANFFALGAALLLFGLFNLLFIGGFFKTAYKFNSFIVYLIVAFLFISLMETLHHFPGLEALNAFGFESLFLQLPLFFSGFLGYLVLTLLSYRCAIRHFEKIDL